MEPRERFSVAKRLKSFIYAFNGIKAMLKYEHNAWMHTLAASVAISLGVVLHISTIEWCLVAIPIGMVFAFELLNTAVEQLANFVCKERNDIIKRVKDLAAGAVLVSALVAVCIAILIFLPKILAT